MTLAHTTGPRPAMRLTATGLGLRELAGQQGIGHGLMQTQQLLAAADGNPSESLGRAEEGVTLVILK